MLNVISWSKDRAPQLDLALCTYKNHFKEWKDQKLSIIYTYSSNKFKEGYDLVRKYHPEFNWIKETRPLKVETDDCILNSKEPYTSFFVDDDVFIDDFSIHDNEFKVFQTNENIACLSCRLAPYVNYCYTQNKPQPQPLIENNTWTWVGAPFDWGYPISVAAFHVFRTQDLAFIKDMPYRGINTFEGGLEGRFPRTRQKMICYTQAKCITSTNNRVQCENANRTDNTHSLDFLNNTFLLSKRLNPTINDKMCVNSCHAPVKYSWR